MTKPDGSIDRGGEKKSTLFCPECGHRGHTTDEWVELRVGGIRLLVCPECRAKIDRRGLGQHSDQDPRPPAEAD